MNGRLILLLGAVAASLLVVACAPMPAWKLCAQGQQLMHLHTKLSIFVDGQPQTVSANIGILPGCHRPLHTHDTDGIIHVESHVVRDYTLGDFFKTWGKELSPEQALSYRAADGYTIRAKAGGADVTDLAGLMLKDSLEIVISITSPRQP
ncbi:MAG: hypothetical protein AAB037_03200 [Chloroflexota bacterium]